MIGTSCLHAVRANVFASVFCTTVVSQAAILENSHAAFTFDEKNNFALKSILDKKTGTEFAFEVEKGDALWSARMMEDGAPSADRPAGAPESVERLDGMMRFKWREAVLEVRLPPDSGVAEWNFEWRSSGAWPYSMTYPRVRPCAVGATDRLYMPQRIGKVLDSPVGKIFNVNPICPNWWSAQFVLFCGDPSAKARPVAANPGAKRAIDGFVRGATPNESTLYFSADDFDFWRKELTLANAKKDAKSFNLALAHIPPWPLLPDDLREARGDFAWRVPYTMRFGVLSGGMERGVAEYRRQVAPHLPAKRMSKRISDCFAWYSIHCAAGELAQIAYDMRSIYRVPVVLHHYRYSLGPANWHPVHRPYREGLREAYAYLGAIDCSVMAYANSLRYARTLPSYESMGMEDAAVRGMTGTVRGMRLHGPPTVYMFPGSQKWIDWNCRFAAELAGTYGTHAYYLDEGAISHAPLDYAASRHPPHGGTYWSRGVQALADATRDAVGRFQKDPFTSTEGFGEHLIGHVDDFLLYGLTLPDGLASHAKGFDHFPITGFAYHDFARAHSDRPDVSLKDDAFRLVTAQAWTWGMNIQSPARKNELASTHTRKIAYCRDMVQCAWQVGARYLAEGEMRLVALVPSRDEIGDAAAAVISEPCRIRNRNVDWCGPSVLAGRFFDPASGREAIALANLTDSSKNVRIVTDRSRFAPNRKRLFRSWPLPVAELKADAEFSFTVNPSAVALLEWRDDEPTPRNLLEEPAPVPKSLQRDELKRLYPNRLESGSPRTFHVHFPVGSMVVAQPKDEDCARTVMMVDNYADKPLTLRVKDHGTYRFRPDSEALLPLSVGNVASSNPRCIPVSVVALDGLPKEEENLFFDAVAAPESVDATGHPLRPVCFTHPVSGPFAPLSFRVKAGVRSFSFFTGWQGECMGVVRNPEGKTVRLRHVADDPFFGGRFDVDVPAGMDGKVWTYSHAWGPNAWLSFGEGVEPLKRDALKPLKHNARTCVALGAIPEKAKPTVTLPKPVPGGAEWSLDRHVITLSRDQIAILHCKLPAPARNITVRTRVTSNRNNGVGIISYLQTFEKGADGMIEVVTSDQLKRQWKDNGPHEMKVSLTRKNAISEFDMVLHCPMSADCKVDVLDLKWSSGAAEKAYENN